MIFRILFCCLICSYSWAQDRFVPGEMIVKLKSASDVSTTYGKGQRSKEWSSSNQAKATQFFDRIEKSQGHRLKKSFEKNNVYQMLTKPGQKVEDAVRELEADPDVEYVEPNYLFSQLNVGGFTHILSEAEMTTLATASSYPATAAPIYVPEAWAKISGNSVPIIAVIDSGLDISHPVFVNTNSIWVNKNEIPNNKIDDDQNGYVDDVNGFNFYSNNPNVFDDNGHGTHVSGIVLGSSQNIFATPLANAKIKIMPLKFIDSSGSGPTSDAIQAIYYAVDNGATVLNNSWGGPTYSRALKEAIAYAYDHGVLFVAAAGNEGMNNDVSAMYPANYDVPNIISVAATTTNDQLATFSNYGNRTVSLAAPGVSIQSTLPAGKFGLSSGTSMATPFVSGVAALIKIDVPNMLAYQMKEIILANSDSISTLDGKVSSHARLNILKVFSAAKSSQVYSDQPEYVLNQSDYLAASSAPAGCGSGSQGMISGSGPIGWLVILGMTLLGAPVALWIWLKRKQK